MMTHIYRQFERPHGALGALAGFVMSHRPSNRERNRWTVVDRAGAGKDKLMNEAAPNRLDQIPTAAGLLTRLAYAQAKAKGVALEPLLKASGFTERQVEDPHLRVSVHDQIKFLNLVADALKDEFLGFHLAQHADLRQIGLFYYAMASSETMNDALRRAVRYFSIVSEGNSLKCVDGGDVRISLHYIGVGRHLDRHQAEGLMARCT